LSNADTHDDPPSSGLELGDHAAGNTARDLARVDRVLHGSLIYHADPDHSRWRRDPRGEVFDESSS
jgi:hypothetical protein